MKLVLSANQSANIYGDLYSKVELGDKLHGIQVGLEECIGAHSQL